MEFENNGIFIQVGDGKKVFIDNLNMQMLTLFSFDDIDFVMSSLQTIRAEILNEQTLNEEK